MKRIGRWSMVALVVLILALLIGRALKLRQAERRELASAAPAQSATLVLSADDLRSVERATLTRTVEISGSLRAVETAYVKAKVAAEVVRLDVREGDRVRAGQLVAQLDTREFSLRLAQAEQQAAAAAAQLEIAQRALANSKALVEQGFISSTALESSVSNAAAARANLQAARAAADLARKSKADASLYSPIAGFVSQRLVQPGERVAVDARILEIVDLSRLELEAAIAPEQIGSVRVGAPVRLRLEGVEREISARVVRISPSALPGSRAVPAYIGIAGSPELRAGMFARGWVEVDRRETLLLPAAAVRNDQARPYVMRVEGDRVMQREPRLGEHGLSDGREVIEVLDGLQASDRVLAGSVGLVRDATRVRLPEVTKSTDEPAPASASR